MSLNILDFLGGDIVYVKNNFSHATGSIAGMVSDDAGIQRTTSTDPTGCMEKREIWDYRVRKVKEAYLDQVSEEKLQENLAIVPKELFHEDQGVQKNPSKLQTTDSFLDIFQDDLRIRIYENTDEQLLFRVLRNLKNAE